MSSAATGGPRRDLIGPLSLLESWDRPAWWTPPGAPHRLEALIGPLEALLDAWPPDDLLAPQHVLAAHPGIQRWLTRELGPGLDTMRAIKRALDPDNIMNPGKIFSLS